MARKKNSEGYTIDYVFPEEYHVAVREITAEYYPVAVSEDWCMKRRIMKCAKEEKTTISGCEKIKLFASHTQSDWSDRLFQSPLLCKMLGIKERDIELAKYFERAIANPEICVALLKEIVKERKPAKLKPTDYCRDYWEYCGDETRDSSDNDGDSGDIADYIEYAIDLITEEDWKHEYVYRNGYWGENAYIWNLVWVVLRTRRQGRKVKLCPFLKAFFENKLLGCENMLNHPENSVGLHKLDYEEYNTTRNEFLDILALWEKSELIEQSLVITTDCDRGRVIRFPKYLRTIMVGIHENIDICPLVPSDNYWKQTDKTDKYQEKTVGSQKRTTDPDDCQKKPDNTETNWKEAEYKKQVEEQKERLYIMNEIVSKASVTLEEEEAYKRIVAYLNYEVSGQKSLNYLCPTEQLLDFKYYGDNMQWEVELKEDQGSYIDLAMHNVKLYYEFCFGMLSEVSKESWSGVRKPNEDYREVAQYTFEKMFAMGLFEYETKLVEEILQEKIPLVDDENCEQTVIFLELVRSECKKIFKAIYEAPGVYNRFMLAKHVIPEVIGNELDSIISAHKMKGQRGRIVKEVTDVDAYIRKMKKQNDVDICEAVLSKIRITNQHYFNIENAIREIEASAEFEIDYKIREDDVKSIYEKCYDYLISQIKEVIYEGKADVIDHRSKLKPMVENFVEERGKWFNKICGWVISSSFYLTQMNI